MPDTTATPTSSTHTTRIPVAGALAARNRRSALPDVPSLEPGTYLAVEDGEDAVVIPVTEPVTRMGRSPSADVELDDATVSRRHALIFLEEDGSARVVDDRSLNGVEVNGARVREAVLKHEDVIALGRIHMRWLHVRA